jgi:hypothetical protein
MVLALLVRCWVGHRNSDCCGGWASKVLLMLCCCVVSTENSVCALRHELLDQNRIEQKYFCLGCGAVHCGRNCRMPGMTLLPPPIFSLKYGGSRFLLNVDKFLSHYTGSQSPPLEPPFLYQSTRFHIPKDWHRVQIVPMYAMKVYGGMEVWLL